MIKHSVTQGCGAADHYCWRRLDPGRRAAGAGPPAQRQHLRTARWRRARPRWRAARSWTR